VRDEGFGGKRRERQGEQRVGRVGRDVVVVVALPIEVIKLIRQILPRLALVPTMANLLKK